MAPRGPPCPLSEILCEKVLTFVCCPVVLLRFWNHVLVCTRFWGPYEGAFEVEEMIEDVEESVLKEVLRFIRTFKEDIRNNLLIEQYPKKSASKGRLS